MNTIAQSFISNYKAAYEKRMARDIERIEKSLAKIDKIFYDISKIPTAYDVQVTKSKFKNLIHINFKDHRFAEENFTVSFWGDNFAKPNVTVEAKNYDYRYAADFDRESVMKEIGLLYRGLEYEKRL